MLVGSAHGRTSALSGLGVVSNLLQSVQRLLLGIMAQLGFRRHRVSRSRQESNDDASADQEAQGLNQDNRTSDSVSNQQQPTSQSLRKRTAGPGKVHGIHDSSEDKSNEKPDGNSYWNGNSTQFDGDE